MPSSTKLTDRKTGGERDKKENNVRKHRSEVRTYKHVRSYGTEKTPTIRVLSYIQYAHVLHRTVSETGNWESNNVTRANIRRTL